MMKMNAKRPAHVPADAPIWFLYINEEATPSGVVTAFDGEGVVATVNSLIGDGEFKFTGHSIFDVLRDVRQHWEREGNFADAEAEHDRSVEASVESYYENQMSPSDKAREDDEYFQDAAFA